MTEERLQKTETFVVWLEGDSCAPHALRGRVEHTRTSQRSRFDCTDELLAIFARATSARLDSTPTPPSAASSDQENET